MTKDELREVLLSKKWKRTTTFDTYPHSYSLEKEWDNKKSFQKAWRFIRLHGEPRTFGRRLYNYLDVDGYDYWAMFTSDGQGIINRAEYGKNKEQI